MTPESAQALFTTYPETWILVSVGLDLAETLALAAEARAHTRVGIGPGAIHLRPQSALLTAVTSDPGVVADLTRVIARGQLRHLQLLPLPEADAARILRTQPLDLVYGRFQERLWTRTGRVLLSMTAKDFVDG